jgi:hypothetical protein
MSASSARKWIELNWLRKGRKEVPLPNLIYCNFENWSGIYYPRQKDEVCIDNCYYDLSERGLIGVNENNCDERGDFEETLAHEWRHHLQRQKYKFAGVKFNNDGDYKENIISYYRDNWHELDAFMFSWRIVETRATTIWFEWLRKAGVVKC